MLDAPPDTRLDHTPSRDRAQPLACRCNAAGWAVARTQPQAERWAASNLQRRGYQVYLPLTTVLRPDRAVPTMRHKVQIPLFSGYLFWWHNRSESWRPVYETPGIKAVIRNGPNLEMARAGAVEAVRAALEDGRYLTPPEALWRPGAPCRLAHGPFQNLDGVVLATGPEMALVSILMLGQLREVAVDLSCLKARDD